MLPGEVEELAGHAQVDDEHRIVVERKEQKLAPAARHRDAAPDKLARQIFAGLAPHRSAPGYLDLGDAPVDHCALEAAPDRLYLGELGHLGPRPVALSGGKGLERARGRETLGELLRRARTSTQQLSS